MEGVDDTDIRPSLIITISMQLTLSATPLIYRAAAKRRLLLAEPYWQRESNRLNKSQQMADSGMTAVT
jgi:hypothetical protein